MNNYNSPAYYRSNPYSDIGYMPPGAHRNRKKMNYGVQIPQGNQFFEPTTKKHYGRSYTTEIEAAVFRRLLKHLDDHKEVQNIDLMILADFCRNCLSKWYSAAAADVGQDIDYEAAREIVYGMPYSEWKDKYQTPASDEQLEAMQAKKN